MFTRQAAQIPTENQILAALPPAEYEQLSPHLEHVHLSRGQVLYAAGELIDYVYFPINTMLSLVSQLPDGASIEVGVTGFEGVAGLPVILGVDRTPHECLTQIAGDARRLPAGALVSAFQHGGRLQALLLRFTQALLLQTSQVAACNDLHTLAERLARWLLMCQDRCICDELPMTHEFLSLMLGVRRAGVSEAAVVLQAEGVINYRRGHVTIMDRPRLELFACECYPIVKAEFDRLRAYAAG
jgi:CRP-like cAMP-binding protein